MSPPAFKCPNCRERAVTHVTQPYSATVMHDGRPYDIHIDELRLLKCGKCNNVILDDEADNRVSDVLRATAGLFSPAEIRTKRLALGLTQKQLAEYLEIAEATLSRWETGGQIQQRAMNELLDLFFRFPDVRGYLKNKRGKSPAPASERQSPATSSTTSLSVCYRATTGGEGAALAAVTPSWSETR